MSDEEKGKEEEEEEGEGEEKEEEEVHNLFFSPEACFKKIFFFFCGFRMKPPLPK